MTNTIEINGEHISTDEARKLVRMLYNDAKKIAGEFHGMNRSDKFRINWPDEYKFADANWKNFVEPCRAMYAARLSDPKTPPHEARQMSLALFIEAKISVGQETDNRLQIAPNTQQFVGDKAENRKIVEKFTKRPNLRAALMNSVATRH
jgi:hypothetical protein